MRLCYQEFMLSGGGVDSTIYCSVLEKVGTDKCIKLWLRACLPVFVETRRWKAEIACAVMKRSMFAV